MSTRGLKGFKYDNTYYGVYNQYDSYPSGLGKNMINTIKNILNTDIDLIHKNIKDLVVSNNKDLLYEYSQKETYIDDTLIGKTKELLDGLHFIYNSLFCEYAYIIDFDKRVLTIFEGFQKEPQKDNPFGESPNEDGYYPSKEVGYISFDDIANHTVGECVEKIESMMD